MQLSTKQKQLIDKMTEGGVDTPSWSVKRLAYELDWTIAQVRNSLYRLQKREIVRKYTSGVVWWHVTHKALLAYKEQYHANRTVA